MRTDGECMDRYTTHIIGCLENAVENAVDGVECHIPYVTVQGAIDLLKEQHEDIADLKKHINHCLCKCAYLHECNPVQFAMCEGWKDGE